MARHFCKSLWQYFLNIIRLIALKMRWLLCIQKQNIYGNWRGLRSLTINQQLDKKAFSWITALKDCVKDWEKQSCTFSFVCITSSKLITISCISMVLSLMWITGQPLKTFSRRCKCKTEIFWSMQWVYKQKLPELIKYQSCKSAN